MVNFIYKHIGLDLDWMKQTDKKSKIKKSGFRNMEYSNSLV